MDRLFELVGLFDTCWVISLWLGCLNWLSHLIWSGSFEPVGTDMVRPFELVGSFDTGWAI